MLIPITRAPIIYSRGSSCCLAPAVAALNSQPAAKERESAAGQQSVPDKNHRYSDAIPADLAKLENGIVKVFGRTTTEKIVGPSLLRYLVSRNFLNADMASSLPLLETMHEPYGSVINALHSKFINAGLFKIHEDDSSVTFSDQQHKLRIVTDRHYLPSEAGIFIDKNEKSYCIRGLQKKMNPEAFLKEVGDLRNILDQYGGQKIDQSQTVKDEAIRDYLTLSFRQMINFMDANKRALSRL